MNSYGKGLVKRGLASIGIREDGCQPALRFNGLGQR
jgi:hypothetical protein